MAGQRLSYGCGSCLKLSGRWWGLWSAGALRQTMHKPHWCSTDQQAHFLQFPLVLEIAYNSEWFGCQCIYPVSLIQWCNNIFYTFECLSCTVLTTGALSNIANLVWPWSAAIFFWIHLLYWIPVPGGTSGPVVEIRLLSYKSEGLGKIAYFTSEKGDWSNC